MKNYLLKSAFMMLLLGGYAAFGQITTLPVVDGDKTDPAWSNAPIFSISSTIDANHIDGINDFSGTVKVLWSNDSIYYLVDVKDDTLYGGTGAAYIYDNVCIYLDAFNKATSTYVDGSQVYWEKNWWQAADQMGGRTGANWTAPKSHFAVNVVNETGYTIELAAAWADFGGKVPAVGDVIGFDVKLSDNDGDFSEYRSQITYRDVTDDGWENPSVFGELTLNADGTTSAKKDFLPSIDGTYDRGWGFSKAVTLPSIISNTGVTGTDDFSGSFQLVWTPDTLYAMVTEKDDSLYGIVDNATYMYDNVCVYLDAFNKKSAAYTDSTQVYYEHNWWQDDTNMGGRTGANWVAPKGHFATNVVSGAGYTLELAIPLGNFFNFAQASPTVGDIMGFDVKLSDGDNDGVRDQITYFDITDNGWQYPSVFGEIQLKANGTVAALSARPAKPAGLAAVIENNGVKLSWGAVSAAASYNVYRNNTKLAEGVTEATYVDENVVDGTYTYFVRSVDANGVLSNASNSVEVEVSSVNQVDANTRIYPNPASGIVNVCSQVGATVNIYNVSGKLVISKVMTSATEQVVISELESGFYLVKVGNKAQTLVVK